jgi:chromosome segregation ATPase
LFFVLALANYISQAAIFADHIASGALTSQLRSERKHLEGKIEHLQMQCTEAIRDKLVAENKSRNLLDKVTVLEKEREDLSRRLNDEKEATAEAKTDAENARAEAKAAHKCATKLELEVNNMRAYPNKTKLATYDGVDRAHTLFVDVYHDLSA